MKKILLVDDDEATNFYNHYIFKKSAINCEIVMLENGLKALNYLKNIDVPDIIFLDINMPVMDGIQFLEEVQKCSNDKFDKVVVYAMISVDLSEEKFERLTAVRKVEIKKGKMLTVEYINNYVNI